MLCDIYQVIIVFYVHCFKYMCLNCNMSQPFFVFWQTLQIKIPLFYSVCCFHGIGGKRQPPPTPYNGDPDVIAVVEAAVKCSKVVNLCVYLVDSWLKIWPGWCSVMYVKGIKSCVAACGMQWASEEWTSEECAVNQKLCVVCGMQWTSEECVVNQ